jgi:hypothetical protein
MSPSWSSNFPYDPLLPRRVRLLLLEPGEEAEPLICSFTDAPLRYEAVSYTWGRSARPCQIHAFLNETTTTQINVTAHLDAALRALRSLDRQRILWIDAVCVNQEDLHEREGQVLYMRATYSRADRTIVWLGDEDDTTENAIACIDRLVDNYTGLVPPSSNTTTLCPWLLDRSDSRYVDTSLWHAFKLLLSKEWYSRVWVFQEVTVSSKIRVRCGRHEVPWEKLVRACKVIRDFNLNIGYTIGYQEHHIPVLHMEDSRVCNINLGAGLESLYQRLDTVLLKMRWAKASDPRDKVYALLGVSSGFRAEDLPPDYTVSLGLAYFRTTKALSNMHALNPLAFLSFVQHDSKTLAVGLPSWVADWREKLNAPSLLYDSGFCAASFRTAKLSFEWNSSGIGLLTAQGIALMKAVYFSPHTGCKREQEDEQILNFALDPYCSGGRTTAFVRSGRIISVHESAETRMSFWRWHSLVSARGAKPPTFVETADFDIPAHDRFDNVTGIAHGRLLFLTELGYVGLAPAASIIGDEIVSLFGGKVLYMTRRVGERFRFIGECYVLGLMHGEILDGLDEARVEHFEFY